MLEFKNIKKCYGDQQVLCGVSMKMESGIKVIIGINGSGKTTLLKIIAGIISGDNGKVFINSRDVTVLPPEERNLGYVPQHPALFNHLTAWDNIIYASRNGRGFAETGKLMVEMLGLQDVLNKKPLELSGGYRSRVSLARALTSDPEVMLLDEPLSDIDASTKEKLWPEFRRTLKNNGIPSIYVTHDLHEAELIGDTFAAMVKGQIVNVASAAEAFEAIKDSYLNETVLSGIAALNVN
ncbi:MAG: ABC transporter ATP-binding protein [Bacillota bacterium]